MCSTQHQQLIALILSAITGTSLASQRIKVDLDDLSLEQLLEVKVVSASKFEQRGRDAPSAAQVISGEEIRRHGWRTLTEALNALPGLYASNDKAYDFLGARGFQITGDYNTRFLLLIDGQRNNDNIYESALTGTEGWLDLSAVERIEYIPGPGSALYGANAMFGVINVITRRGNATGQSELGVSLSQLYGTGVNLHTSHTIKGNGQDTHIFLQYSADKKTGRDISYRDPLGQLIRADGSVSPDGVAHGLDKGRNHHLMARIDSGEWAMRLINHERSVTPSSANYFSLFDDPSLTVMEGGTQFNASFDHVLSNQSSLHARLGYTDFYYRGVYPYLDASVGYYQNRDDVRGRVLDGELRYQWASGAHQWVTGLEISRDLLAKQVNTNSVSAASLGTQDVDINTPVKHSALFLQDTWQVSEAWLVSLGARMDSTSQQATSTSPRLGVIWQAAPDWTAKLLTGRAYRRPNAYESQFTNTVVYLNNPSLQGETIRTTEGVLEWRRNGGNRWQLSMYQNRLDNIIQQIDTTGTGLFQFQNLGSTTIRGTELGLEQQYAAGAQLRASLAFNHARNNAGNKVDNSPTWIAKTSGNAPMIGGMIILAGELQLIGPRSYDWNAAIYSVPTEVTSNITATFPNLFAQGWQGQVRITNLLDRRIALPASAEILTPKVPQNGRQVTATLSYVF